MWQPLLEQDYGFYFDQCRHTYEHYLDTVREKINGEPLLKVDSSKCIYYYTALDTELYQPAVLYTDATDQTGIIFDSCCTTTITPYASDFNVPITQVKKSITGLGATATVKGEGTARWTFRDDYGCTQHIIVKSYHVPTSSVRLFSP